MTTELSVIDGMNVEITRDGTTTYMRVLDEPKIEKKDDRNWWQKLKDWWNDAPVKPYVKVRDLSDPFGDRQNDPFDDGSGSKTAAEVGIRIDF